MTSLRLVMLIAAGLLSIGVPAQSQEHGSWSRVESAFRIAAATPTTYTFDEGHMNVTEGRALVEPNETIEVQMPLALTHVNRKALVFFRADKGINRVLVLVGNAVVHVGPHANTLQAGDEVVVADHEPVFNELLKDDIGRRRVRISKIDDKTIVQTEFSLVHAIEREPLLYSLVHSDSKDSKVIKGKLIKMAAALGMATSRHGPYTTSPR